jgi:hypothetical protein
MGLVVTTPIAEACDARLLERERQHEHEDEQATREDPPHGLEKSEPLRRARQAAPPAFAPADGRSARAIRCR